MAPNSSAGVLLLLLAAAAADDDGSLDEAGRALDDEDAAPLLLPPPAVDGNDAWRERGAGTCASDGAAAAGRFEFRTAAAVATGLAAPPDQAELLVRDAATFAHPLLPDCFDPSRCMARRAAARASSFWISDMLFL